MDKECAESRVQSEVTLGAQIAGCVERRVRAGESRPGRSFYGGSAARLWTKLHRQSSGSVAMYRIAAVQVGLGYRGVPPKVSWPRKLHVRKYLLHFLMLRFQHGLARVAEADS